MYNQNYTPSEGRYGLPTADQIIFNRQYTIGYSYQLRQPKWVLEVIDTQSSVDNIDDRSNSFRPDCRVPELFRVTEKDYKGSGFDRGHLIASANRLSSSVANSETFLMSNMSPQLPSLNRGIWKQLEEEVRQLAEKDNIVEVYTICGPLWSLGKEIEPIVSESNLRILIPIPHIFFKCILTESDRGKFKFYAFMIPNETKLGVLSDYQFTTEEVEIFSGLFLWDRLSGKAIQNQKSKKYKLWF